MAPQRAAQEFIGHKLLDREGHNVGKIDQVYFDDQTNTPKWVTVQMGMLGTKHSFVPLEGSRDADEDFMVPFDKDTIKDAPEFDAERHLSVEEEDELYRHYGVMVPGPRASADGGGRHSRDAGTADPDMDARGDMDARSDMRGTNADDDVTMVRSEEQAHVGVEREQTGEARVHKSVDTEHFERDVPVSHEEVQVERIPLSDADRAEAGTTGRISDADEEQRVTLYAERAVVAKETVPVEEVRISKTEVTEEQHVEGELRKERIDVERDDARAERDLDEGDLGRPGGA